MRITFVVSFHLIDQLLKWYHRYYYSSRLSTKATLKYSKVYKRLIIILLVKQSREISMFGMNRDAVWKSDILSNILKNATLRCRMSHLTGIDL